MSPSYFQAVWRQWYADNEVHPSHVEVLHTLQSKGFLPPQGNSVSSVADRFFLRFRPDGRWYDGENWTETFELARQYGTSGAASNSRNHLWHKAHHLPGYDYPERTDYQDYASHRVHWKDSSGRFIRYNVEVVVRVAVLPASDYPDLSKVT